MPAAARLGHPLRPRERPHALLHLRPPQGVRVGWCRFVTAKSHWHVHCRPSSPLCCSLEVDQCAALNAFGGACAVGATISADSTKADAVRVFADSRIRYIFYAAESKDKFPETGRTELDKQSDGRPSRQSTFVHVFDEVHVASTWTDFRPAFSDFRALLAGVPLHHMVCPFPLSFPSRSDCLTRASISNPAPLRCSVMAQLLLTATLPKEGLRKVLRAGFNIPLDEAEVVDRPVTRANMTLLNIATSRAFLRSLSAGFFAAGRPTWTQTFAVLCC